MARQSDAPSSSFAPTALEASHVGTWRYDHARDQLRGDEKFAAIFGFDPSELASGLSLAPIMERVEPADRHVIHRHNMVARALGGHIVSELRVHPTPTTMRWIVSRGHFEARRQPDGSQSSIGHGIVLDITPMKDTYLTGKAFCAISLLEPYRDEQPLQEVVDLALALQDRLGAYGADLAREKATLNLLLVSLGRRIARMPDGD